MKRLVFTLSAFAAAVAVAASLEVGDVAGRTFLTENTTMTATTGSYSAEYPAELGDPAFWFDASDTDDWTFGESSGLSGCALKVPSKVGTRYLSVDVTEGVDTWAGWYATDKKTELYPPRAPQLIVDPSLPGGGGHCLDFRATQSRRALVFNMFSPGEGVAASNDLTGIGSVFAVWYANANDVGNRQGGYILGGDGQNEWIGWLRGQDENLTDVNAYRATSPMMRSMGDNAPATYGLLRQDGHSQNPTKIGMYDQGWHVLSLVLTNATGRATGIGINDGRPYGWQWSGGMRIAEMLIFGRSLSVEEAAQVERYLGKKWLNRDATGYNGVAHVGLVHDQNKTGSDSAGLQHELAVPAGTTLTVDALAGGHGSGTPSVTKTGEGSLQAGDFSEYGGTLKLAAGTLTFDRRDIPALDDLPTSFAHFDASAAETLTTVTNGTDELLTGWTSLGGTTLKGTQPCLSSFYSSNRSPWLRRDGLGPGKHVVDLGPFNQYNGRYLYTTTAPLGTETTFHHITTIIAVYSTRGEGGNILKSKMLDRSQGVGTQTGWIGSPVRQTRGNDNPLWPLFPAAEGVALTDGVRMSLSEAYHREGFQVLAIQVPASSFSRMGIHSDNYGMGGMMFAEMFLYDRVLSDREMRDVSAYLEKKWFDRVAPGYAAPGRTDLVQNLAATGAATVRVPDGRTVRAGSLTLDAALTKEGKGTLEVSSAASGDAGALKVAAGTARLAAPTVPASASVCADDPALHIDANDPTLVTVSVADGKNYAYEIHDKGHRRTLYGHSSARIPEITSDGAPEGLKLFDYGGFGYSGRYSYFDKPVESVRSAYFVLRFTTTDTGCRLFGSCGKYSVYPRNGSNSTYDDGARGTSSGALFANAPASQSTVYVDGALESPTYVPDGDLHLFEVHFPRGVHISALAGEGDWANTAKNGGQKIGEVVLYDRVLSEGEKVATRNALMKKWFGTAPVGLPTDEASSFALESAEVASGATLAVEADSTISQLTGEGTVEVSAGTLTLDRATARVEPRLVTEGRVAHFDAADVESFTLSASGGTVEAWRSQVGDGWSAVSCLKYMKDTGLTVYAPSYGTYSFRGVKAVQMRSGAFMLFENPQGITNDIERVRTAFIVTGTPGIGGGFLLGGGRMSPGAPRAHAWHRGGTNCGAYESSVGDPLTCSNAGGGWDSDWYLNGELVDGRTTGLRANEWQLVEVVVPENLSPSVSGLAFDGRVLGDDTTVRPADFVWRAGHQVLAEVILYNRRLSEAERLAVEAHLQAKWGFVQTNTAVSAAVHVGAGASLDLGGKRQCLSHLESEGAVVNGTLALETLVADAAKAPLALTGTLEIAAGQKVEVRNLAALPAEENLIPIVRADAYAGLENLETAVFSGEETPVPAKLVVRKGLLCARVRGKGMLMIVR